MDQFIAEYRNQLISRGSQLGLEETIRTRTTKPNNGLTTIQNYLKSIRCCDLTMLSIFEVDCWHSRMEDLSRKMFESLLLVELLVLLCIFYTPSDSDENMFDAILE